MMDITIQGGRSIFLHSSSKTVRAPRLLIVDDEKDFRLSLRDFLQEEGFQCEEAEDGVDALQVLVHQPFDVVLTDYRMPVLNGFGLKDALAQHPPLQSLPIILLTAEVNESLHRRAEEAGFAAMFVKPFNTALLLSALHRILHGEPRVDQT